MIRKMSGFLAAAGAALLLVGCDKAESAQSEVGVGGEANWTAVNGSSDETSYSRLTEINAQNAGQLGLAWSLDLPGEVSLEATPLAIDGKLYFTGSYAAVYAVDATTGRLLWKYDPKTWQYDPMKMHFSFAANRGLAYENGKLFVAALDGRLIALDAATGKELWATQTIPAGVNAIITGAPRVMNGKVVIGNGGADFGTRGFLSAYSADTGKQLWRFYVTPASPEQNKGDPAMEAAAKTWDANFWTKTGGGGGPWNGITFDPALNRIYFGTGNASPYDPKVRGAGDNLYTASIVALDADTGKYVWHYQPNPGDSWDYDNTQQMTLATLTIDGKPRQVLMQAPKNGFFYVIDRQTGKLINEPGKTTVVTWASGVDMKTGRPIEEPNIRYENGVAEIWPGTIGGHNWQAMSYSPRTGLVYIPIQQLGGKFERSDEQSDTSFNVMGLLTSQLNTKPGDGHGFLVAWDPVAQKQVWSVQHDHVWNGGTLATAGGLVFQGTAEGKFNAYDASSGKQLWSFDAGLGIIAAPMTYTVGGKQYVSVLVGWGGTAAAESAYLNVGWKYGAQPRRLLTFALGGTAKLAPSPPADMTVHALDDPKLVINEADVAAGRAISVQCAACHGVGFQGAGAPGPDLRESAIALDLASFSQLLKTGALIDRGMPRFEMLSDDQIRQLHAYIRARAREALGIRKPQAGPPPPARL